MVTVGGSGKSSERVSVPRSDPGRGGHKTLPYGVPWSQSPLSEQLPPPLLMRRWSFFRFFPQRPCPPPLLMRRWSTGCCIMATNVVEVSATNGTRERLADRRSTVLDGRGRKRRPLEERGRDLGARDFEGLVKRWKRNSQTVVAEFKRRRFYQPPSEQRRLAKAKAEKRARRAQMKRERAERRNG
jgi:ribosomal protein S21